MVRLRISPPLPHHRITLRCAAGAPSTSCPSSPATLACAVRVRLSVRASPSTTVTSPRDGGTQVVLEVAEKALTSLAQ